jgi:hypothetical protein
MDKEGKSSEQAELFADGSAQPEALARGGDDGDSAKSRRYHARLARHG